MVLKRSNAGTAGASCKGAVSLRSGPAGAGARIGFDLSSWAGRRVAWLAGRRLTLSAPRGARCIDCRRPSRAWLALLVFVLALPLPSGAHFGVILPSTETVGSPDERDVALEIMFMHPFEGALMDMARPRRAGVRVRGETVDLLSALRPGQQDGQRTWSASYHVRRPGDHVFFVEPEPYFEPSEQSFIVHYTKVVVHALGMESGWDEPLGLKTEIVPLTRPYGLWAGNVFQGQVLRDGAPVPGAEVEVELLARGQVRAPADPFVTQVVRADASGVFSWGLPCAGWWGFAALTTDTVLRRHTDGRDYPVETGAVLWVRARRME